MTFVSRLAKDRRGFGHFVAIGLGVAAMFVLFHLIFPAAVGMMSTTTNSMTTLDNQMLSTVSNGA